MRINSLEVSDVKKVNAVAIDFKKDGMTIIGGKNRQGKTSVLSAIMYVLGGENYRPKNFKREGSEEDGFIRLTFDDGIVCERRGKDARLTVYDKTGKVPSGQALLNKFVSKFSLDLPKFLNGSDKEKAEILLSLLPIGDELKKLDETETTLYDERTLVNREADQKEKAAKEMPFYPDLPEDEVSITALTQKLQDILAANATIVAASKKIEQSKQNLVSMINQKNALATQKANLKVKVDQQREALRLQLEKLDSMFTEQNATIDKQISEKDTAIGTLTNEIADAEAAAANGGKAQDTSAVEAEIKNCETKNAQIRQNKARKDAIEMANAKKKESDSLTEKIEAVRRKRVALLDGADLPYPGLSVQNGMLYLNDKAWDCMSGSEQLIVSCAIASALNPECKFVLMDKLEQFDQTTLDEFDTWLQSKGIQVIGTRVSTGKECSIIIEDGYVVGQEDVVIDKTPTKKLMAEKAVCAKDEANAPKPAEASASATEKKVVADDEDIKIDVPEYNPDAPVGETEEMTSEDAMETAMRLLQEARDKRNGGSSAAE